MSKVEEPVEELKGDNFQAQMRKGVLDYCILLIVAKGPAYASDILSSLKKVDLIVVEGTIYPLLSRLRRSGLVDYTWVESTAGPPRKYYSLTQSGEDKLQQMTQQWIAFISSVDTLRGKHE